MQAKNKLRQSKSDSFVVVNSIAQLPEAGQKKRFKRINGFEVVMPPLDPYLVAKVSSESVTLRSVINSISNFVSSGMITGDEKFISKLEKDLNSKYDIYELLLRVAKDRLTFGSGYIHEIKVGKEQFFWHLPTSSVRLIEDKDSEYTAVAISKDWNDSKVKPYEVSLYPEYREIEGKQHRVIQLTEYDTNNKDYPLPKWVGAWYDANVESLIGQYNANQFENGITLSSILQFDFGEGLSVDQLKEQKEKLERNLKGTSGGNSGKALIVPTSGGVLAPTYVQYPMNKEGSYLELQKLVENNLVKACSWFRSLAGLESSGSLGNNQQMRNEWEMAEKLIRNEQYLILGAIVKALEKTPLYPNEWEVNNSSPINLANDIASLSDILVKTNKLELKPEQAQEMLILLGFDEETSLKLTR